MSGVNSNQARQTVFVEIPVVGAAPAPCGDGRTPRATSTCAGCLVRECRAKDSAA